MRAKRRSRWWSPCHPDNALGVDPALSSRGRAALANRVDEQALKAATPGTRVSPSARFEASARRNPRALRNGPLLANARGMPPLFFSLTALFIVVGCAAS